MKPTYKKLIVIFAVFFLFITTFTSVYLALFKRPYLTIIGPVEMADGIGRQSVEIIDALKEDFPIGFLQTCEPNFVDVPRKVKKIIKNKYRPFGKVVLFFETVWSPEKEHYQILRTPKNKDQIRFAYSMFEASKIPQQWVSILNQYFDGVVVPDPYHVKVYEDSGVIIPVFVLPLGLNLKPLLECSLKEKKQDPFIFGNFGSGISRKNQALLVRAFYQAFGDNPSVKLKINARYAHPDVKKEIEDFIKMHECNNISFSIKSLKGSEYIEELKSLDCLVYLSKGEGFSIQPREALALGIPVMLTDNTAHTTLCKSGLVKKIPSLIEEPALFTWGTILKEAVAIGKQYNCDKEDVIEGLKEVYSNYETYLKKNQQMRSWVRKYDYDEAKIFYQALLQPKKIILSTKNKITKDALYTNSKDLINKYEKILKKGF